MIEVDAFRAQHKGLGYLCGIMTKGECLGAKQGRVHSNDKNCNIHSSEA
jgi:hypothetical protein